MSASETDLKHPEPVSHVYSFGRFQLDTKDTTNNRLLCDGQPLKINEMPFRVLRVLVEHRGQELSTEQLFHKVWREEVNWDDNSGPGVKARNAARNRVQAHISDLRRTLPGATTFIKTVDPKKGVYSFEVPIATKEPRPFLFNLCILLFVQILYTER